ncbi:MAG TPA: plastocyanin/azurin family copper-binding protein [Longimicrobiales bacterium]|nr:plastocyanin/azurin family copper-binding protein [Longimicrobiales bacterium]
MLQFVRAILITVAVLVPAGLVTACSGDGNVVGTDPTRIQVTVQADGVGASGITVRLYASGGSTALNEATTSGSGQVTFSGLDAGTFDVEVVVPSNLELDEGEARRPVTVGAGSTATVTFSLVSVLPPGTTEVVLDAASFSPASVTIAPGAMVRWRNGGAVAHTITPDGHSEWTSVSMSASGETFEHTFNTAGSYPYLCQLHTGMTGTVTVQQP